MSKTERQQCVLKAAVEGYIHSAEPVGSKWICDERLPQYSPATIRNDLHALEDSGCLLQPHTSSGRIPTDKGYRAYVDQLLAAADVGDDPVPNGLSDLPITTAELTHVLSDITHTLSSVTQYTALVLTPSVYQEALKLLYMVLVEMDKILVVLLNEAGGKDEMTCHLSEQLDQDDLNKISQFLTEKLKGKSIADVDDVFVQESLAALPRFKVLLKTLFEDIASHVATGKGRRLLTGSVSQMLALPEFHDVQLTQKVLGALEESRLLLALMGDYLHRRGCDVIIGDENPVEALQDCAMVLAPFSKENKANGVVGLLGPKRMAYPTVMPMLSHVSRLIGARVLAEEVG